VGKCKFVTKKEPHFWRTDLIAEEIESSHFKWCKFLPQNSYGTDLACLKNAK